jgi:hypothetical protein
MTLPVISADLIGKGRMQAAVRCGHRVLNLPRFGQFSTIPI